MEPRVLVMPRSALRSSDVVSVACLSREERQVLVTDDGQVLELQTLQRRLGSWLIDESVEGKGQLFMATPLDVVFVMLPLLLRGSASFRPLADLVTEGGAAYALLAARIPDLGVRLSVVCDRKEVPGVEGEFVRLSRERLFRWLLCKVDAARVAVAAGLAGQISSGGASESRSLNLVEASSLGSAGAAAPLAGHSEESILLTAVDLVRDYLNADLGDALLRHYKLGEAVTRARVAHFNDALSDAANNMRPTSSSGAFGPAAAKKVKETPVTAGAKRLRKTNTDGMSKLTDMFKRGKK